ncbi:MAG: FCD domain-containing protein [Pseudomonadota bacterium]
MSRENLPNEFRELIEISLLEKTIGRIDKAGLSKLKTTLNNHPEAVRDIFLKERLLRDMEFHLALAQLSGCTIQVNIPQIPVRSPVPEISGEHSVRNPHGNR